MFVELEACCFVSLSASFRSVDAKSKSKGENVAHCVVGLNLTLVATVQHTSHSTFTIHPMTIITLPCGKKWFYLFFLYLLMPTKGFSGIFNPMVFSPVVWDSGVLTPRGPT